MRCVQIVVGNVNKKKISRPRAKLLAKANDGLANSGENGSIKAALCEWQRDTFHVRATSQILSART